MSASGTIASYSDWYSLPPWKEFEPVDILKRPDETDTQLQMNFTEQTKTFIDGVEYVVTSGNGPLSVVSLPKPDAPLKIQSWTYKIGYHMSSSPKAVQLTQTKTRRVKLNPHARFTKEILRRPNKYGK
jgi:hypothetical protein